MPPPPRVSPSLASLVTAAVRCHTRVYFDWFSWAGETAQGGLAVGRGARLPLGLRGCPPGMRPRDWASSFRTLGTSPPSQSLCLQNGTREVPPGVKVSAVCVHLPPAGLACGRVRTREKLWETWTAPGSTGSWVGAEGVMCCLVHVCTATCLSVFLGRHANPLMGAHGPTR